MIRSAPGPSAAVGAINFLRDHGRTGAQGERLAVNAGRFSYTVSASSKGMYMKTRAQMFREKAAECLRLKEETTIAHFKETYASSAAQWLQLAEDAERVEQNYPNRPHRWDRKSALKDL
jgi:hypothetical protein